MDVCVCVWEEGGHISRRLTKKREMNEWMKRKHWQLQLQHAKKNKVLKGKKSIYVSTLHWHCWCYFGWSTFNVRSPFSVFISVCLVEKRDHHKLPCVCVRALDAVQFDLNQHWYYNLWFVIYFIHLPLGEINLFLAEKRNITIITTNIESTVRSRARTILHTYHIASFFSYILISLHSASSFCIASPYLASLFLFYAHFAAHTHNTHIQMNVHYTIESFDWINQ